MQKELSEMSIEERWNLFPIMLTEHKSYWTDWYKQETELLKKMLPNDIKFYHIGSTAILGIVAKPIIDIIIVANSSSQLRQIANILQNHNYITMSVSENRISLNKGYTKSGFAEKVFHLHIRMQNDVDELYFKDYLNANLDIAKKYEKLKLSLCEKHKYNRDAYTEAKTEFIKKHTQIAKQNASNLQ